MLMKRSIEYSLFLALVSVLVPSTVSSASCGPLQIQQGSAGNVRVEWADGCQLQATTSLEGSPV